MKKYALLFIIISVLTALCACTETKNQAEYLGFRAAFLNVGKADCIIVQMDEVNILCDTGKSESSNKIISVLTEYGIERIDYMILTHFDKDHIGSAGVLIRNYDVGTVYAPDTSADSDAYERLVNALTAKKAQLTVLTENVVIGTANGSVKIYAPHESDYESDNAYSLITAITYKGKSMLLTGDATKKRLSEFLSEDTGISYDVIKFPHHGEYTKSLLALLSRADARYGIITCASDKATVEEKAEKAAEQYEVELFYTCDGDVVFGYEDGEGFYIRK